MSRPSIDHERALEVVKWAKDNKISNWIAIDDLRLAQQFKWLSPRIPMWRHVAVDGDFGYGGRLRDKIDECINKLNR
jgi:NAD(P)H-hydrate repair Nnr-like enzyme with NAD(P)H-hydrate epimerase domain